MSEMLKWNSVHVVIATWYLYSILSLSLGPESWNKAPWGNAHEQHHWDSSCLLQRKIHKWDRHLLLEGPRLYTVEKYQHIRNRFAHFETAIKPRLEPSDIHFCQYWLRWWEGLDWICRLKLSCFCSGGENLHNECNHGEIWADYTCNAHSKVWGLGDFSILIYFKM